MTGVALNFFGPTNGPATTRMRNAICSFASEMVQTPDGPVRKYDKLFLLMSSGGGSLEDGFALYNLILLAPIEVVTVNMGQIASIANVPFLAGTTRIACPHSYFHFHNFDWTYPTAHTMTRDQFTDHTQLIDIARNNKRALFKQHTHLTDLDFEALKFLDEPLVKDASFALEKGIVHEVGMPNIPAGTPFFNVDY